MHQDACERRISLETQARNDDETQLEVQLLQANAVVEQYRAAHQTAIKQTADMTDDVLLLRAEKTKSDAEVLRLRAQQADTPRDSDTTMTDLYNRTIDDITSQCNSRVAVATGQTQQAQEQLREIVLGAKKRFDVPLANKQELIDRLKREAS